MSRLEARHPDLAEKAAAWHAEHPGGTLEEAVSDLGLWRNPQDRDAQWLVWRHLPEAVRAVLAPGGGSGHPVRDLVAATIRGRIADGTYPPGSRLPRLAELAAEHHCSVTPVASAYALLISEELISGVRRQGWWVSAEGAR